MSTVSESGRLGEESAIGERCSEVGDRFAFYQHLLVNQVIPGGESDHLHVEGADSSYGVEERCLMFRVIDMKSVKRSGHGVLRQDSTNDSIAREPAATTVATWRRSPRSQSGETADAELPGGRATAPLPGAPRVADPWNDGAIVERRRSSEKIVPTPTTSKELRFRRPRPTFSHGHRGDAEGESADARFEDALRSLERHSLAVQDEAALKRPAIEQLR